MTISEPIYADSSTADIDASEALATSTGQDVVVAVIDTGVDYSHPDLVSNLWTNLGEIPGNDLDDDGNGYVDDYYGYDFVNSDGDPTDDNGHGTHIAGIIAADDDNAFGTVGVAPDAKIMVLKVLDEDSEGTTFNAIQAVEYAILMGTDVINASWGGGDYSQDLSDAIAAAANVGILFVAAAGNAGTNNDIEPQYPASYDLDNVISVGASAASDPLASFSNYGPTSVDLVAPGDQIYSTLPDGSYGTLSGTSMAAPHVTGTVALLRAAYPTLSPNALKAAILKSTDPLPELTDVVASGGRLNASQALANGATQVSALATDSLTGSQWLGVNPLQEDDDLIESAAGSATRTTALLERRRGHDLLSVATSVIASRPLAEIKSLPGAQTSAIAEMPPSLPCGLDASGLRTTNVLTAWPNQASSVEHLA
ncbi:MAG: S8 family peptidase [Elainellaceae cyanobacterium]